MDTRLACLACDPGRERRSFPPHLEARLNVRLCNRGRQGFSLTPPGQQVLDETIALLDHLDRYANRLNQIGHQSDQEVRIGVVDSLIVDPGNTLSEVVRSANAEFKDLRVSVGIYDYLDCLTELRSGRLDIAVVGVGTDENLPGDLATNHVFDEISGLFCSPGHPCAFATGPDELTEKLKNSKISAHSFLNNPIDENLDLLLFDEQAEISQANIESATYLALAGTHVGLIPIHYAHQWAKCGELVEVGAETYRIISQIHAVQLKSASHNEVVSKIWERLTGG